MLGEIVVEVFGADERRAADVDDAHLVHQQQRFRAAACETAAINLLLSFSRFLARRGRNGWKISASLAQRPIDVAGEALHICHDKPARIEKWDGVTLSMKLVTIRKHHVTT